MRSSCGFEKGKLADAQVIVSVGEEGDTDSTRTQGIKQTLFKLSKVRPNIKLHNNMVEQWGERWIIFDGEEFMLDNPPEGKVEPFNKRGEDLSINNKVEPLFGYEVELTPVRLNKRKYGDGEGSFVGPIHFLEEEKRKETELIQERIWTDKKDKELGGTARTGERFGEATFPPCESDRGLFTIDHQRRSSDTEGNFQQTTLSEVLGVADDLSNKNCWEWGVC